MSYIILLGRAVEIIQLVRKTKPQTLKPATKNKFPDKMTIIMIGK